MLFKLPANWMIIQQLIQAVIKQNITLLLTEPLCGESTDESRIPIPKGQ